MDAVNNVPGAGGYLTYGGLHEGDSGPFRISTPYNAGKYSGPLRICAYSLYIIDDAAHAETTVTIKPARPRNTARPRVTRAGGTLTCQHGGWSGDPTRYSYRWRVGDGRYGRSVKTARHAIGAAERGKAVSCSVTARNAAGSATATSRAYHVR